MCEKRDLSAVVAVTARQLAAGDFLDQVEKVCRLRPRALMLREKDLTEEEYADLLNRVIPICRRWQVPLLGHFFLEAVAKARRCHGDVLVGIHLPLWKAEEAAFSKERAFCGQLGISVHSLEEVKRAENIGADYLLAGHIFATACKEGLAPRGLTFLREVCGRTRIPVFAIGGIHLKDPDGGAGQVRQVLEAGAEAACIMSDLMKI